MSTASVVEFSAAKISTKLFWISCLCLLRSQYSKVEGGASVKKIQLIPLYPIPPLVDTTQDNILRRGIIYTVLYRWVGGLISLKGGNATRTRACCMSVLSPLSILTFQLLTATANFRSSSLSGIPSQRATPGGVSLGTLSVQQAQHTALRLTSVRQHVLRTRYPLRWSASISCLTSFRGNLQLLRTYDEFWTKVAKWVELDN